MKVEPLAVDLRFTRDSLHVRLADGREVAAPLEWFPRLRKATPAQRRHWLLIGGGIGVRWEEIDEDNLGREPAFAGVSHCEVLRGPPCHGLLRQA